jgi:hypothetical protein
MDIDLSYVNRNRLLVRGDAHGWGFAAVAHGGKELRNVFSNCPYWDNGPSSRAAAEGDLEPVAVKLPERSLLRGKKKTFVLHGGQVDCYEAAGFSTCGLEEGNFRGKIITTWKLTLKRVKPAFPKIPTKGAP